jgi:signal transduction histidine kinase
MKDRTDTLLVVDDNAISRLVLVETLRGAGYRVHEVDSGEACRRWLREDRPDLILLDVNLPDANGMDLCREIKSDPRYESVFIGLISTSRITPDQQAEGLNLGADAYITRPVPEDELLARIGALLRIRRAERALLDANEALEQKVAERTADLARANAALLGEVAERRTAESAQHRLATRLSVLRTLDQAILQATSSGEIAVASVACLEELVPAGLIQIWQVDGETEELQFLAGTGSEPVGATPLPFNPLIRDTLEELAETTDLIRNEATHPFAPGNSRTWSHLHLLSVRAREALLGVVLLAFPSTDPPPPDYQAGGLEIAGTLAIALSQARLFTEVSEGRRRMQDLSRRMLQVQEEERRFLSRELHDQIGQSLTGIKALLESGLHTGPDPDLTGKLDKALGVVNELMGQVRQLSIDLRPQMLDELGLLKALGWHFNRLREQAGLMVEFQHNVPADRRLPPQVEIALFRITQEALTNVIRHAGVDIAQVVLWVDPERCRLQIRDSGTGFDARRQLREFRTSGLSGMMERAQLLDGELQLESSTGDGTCLTVDLPFT